MGNAMAGEGIHVIDICILVVESKKLKKNFDFSSLLPWWLRLQPFKVDFWNNLACE